MMSPDTAIAYFRATVDVRADARLPSSMVATTHHDRSRRTLPQRHCEVMHHSLSLWLGALHRMLSGRRRTLPAAEHRIELEVDDALLERDQRIVGDLDVLRANLSAALRDVAVAQTVIVLCRRRPGQPDILSRVEWVHVELGNPHEETRTGERGLVLLVIAHDVAGVLAQEALDALAELLRALDVDLLHPVVAGLDAFGRYERPNL